MTAEARQLKDAVDQFLIDEAELLDSWRLKEWRPYSPMMAVT